MQMVIQTTQILPEVLGWFVSPVMLSQRDVRQGTRRDQGRPLKYQLQNTRISYLTWIKQINQELLRTREVEKCEFRLGLQSFLRVEKSAFGHGCRESQSSCSEQEIPLSAVVLLSRKPFAFPRARLPQSHTDLFSGLTSAKTLVLLLLPVLIDPGAGSPASS